MRAMIIQIKNWGTFNVQKQTLTEIGTMLRWGTIKQPYLDINDNKLWVISVLKYGITFDYIVK